MKNFKSKLCSAILRSNLMSSCDVFFITLFLTFLCLKLTNLASLPWLIAFLPIIAYIALYILLGIVVFFVALSLVFKVYRGGNIDDILYPYENACELYITEANDKSLKMKDQLKELKEKLEDIKRQGENAQ